MLRCEGNPLDGTGLAATALLAKAWLEEIRVLQVNLSMVQAPRRVVTWGNQQSGSHEDASHAAMAQRVAALLGLDYAGRGEDGGDLFHSYGVPRQTLCGEASLPCGLPLTESDFLGGWVPHSLYTTKAIVHAPAPGDVPPDGWPVDFVRAVAPVVLRGYTAFTRAGAERAGAELLGLGPVRVKVAGADGGRLQHVVDNRAALKTVLDTFDRGDGLCDALVLEENLAYATTFSIGSIRIGAASAAYIGTQTTTRDNFGDEVYGGSDLHFVRGDFSCLTGHSSDEREVCALANRFDQAALRHLGLVGSRRNYDGIVGLDGAGRRRAAILEQSWRIGGATGAELLALEAYSREPSRARVHASTVELYGSDHVAPEGAAIFFQGEDSRVGPMLKYAIVRD